MRTIAENKANAASAGMSHGYGLIFLVLALYGSMAQAWDGPVSAYNDVDCLGTRNGSALNCTANDFVVNAVFSAAPDTPPFCVAGNYFDFLVDLDIASGSPTRYDITYYVGQDLQTPQINDPTKSCSATAFPLPPTLPAPWASLDGGINNCADFTSRGSSTVRINKIKVTCAGDANGYLSIPYLLAYQNSAAKDSSCNISAPSTYPIPVTSKCQTGASSVSGTVKVFSGAYVDVTKQTLPDGDPQSFSFNAVGSPGSYVIALTDSTTLDLPQPLDGTYTPTNAAAATNSVNNITLTDGETARFYINALASVQTLTITEAATTNWETTVSMTCNNVTGNPNPTVNNATRTVSANLTTTNSAAACTITNTKRSRMTLVKSILGGRIDAADQFTVSASGGGTLTGTPTVTTSGSATTASTSFYSTPGQALTLTDAKAPFGGGPTPLSSYLSFLTCTGTYTGSGTLPNGAATTSASLTPGPGDDVTCTFVNMPIPEPPTLAKSFIPTIVALNATATLRLVVTNPNTYSSLNGIAFTDTLPAGMTATNGTTPVCGGSLVITGNNQLAFSGGTLASSASCNIDVTVTGTAAGAHHNTTGVVSATESDAGAPSNTATLSVYAAPTVTKMFTPSSIVSGESSNMSITVTNPISNPGNLTGVSISDSYGGTITNDGPGSVVCSGAGSATLSGSVIGGTTVGFINGTLVPGGTCTIYQSVTAASTSTNTTGAPVATGPVTVTGTAAGPVTLSAGFPILTVVKSANAGAGVNPGQIVTYAILVSNTGTGSAINVTVTDVVPNFTTYVANSTRLNGISVAGDGATLPLISGMLIDNNASRSAGSFASGILPAGASATVTFMVVVN